MNKLKKPRPGESSGNGMSRTMQLAIGGTKVPATNERYWATRALVAETLLSARDRHQAELTAMRRMEAEKREAEIRAILDAIDQKQKIMLLCLAVLLGFIAWLVMMVTDTKGRSSHFTIPILSPFASVVEHETGVFGTRALVASVVVIGIALYAALRHWLVVD